MWDIDANPQDINQVDYYKPDGTPVMRTVADYRQLNDALFNAGTNSGSSVEYMAAPTTCTSTSSTSTPTRAAPALHGRRPRRPAPARRSAASRSPPRPRDALRAHDLHVPAQQHRRGGRPMPAPAPAGRDRVARAATSTACRRRPPARAGRRTCKNALATAKFGESGPGAGLHRQGRRRGGVGHGHADGDVGERSVEDDLRDLRADGDRRHRRRLGAGDAVADAGHAGHFGAFTPGVQKDYFATTTATVTSTAGDATLSVADPSRPTPATWSTARSRCPRRCRPTVLGTTSDDIYAPVGGSATPTSLLTWAAPVSNAGVTIGFKQPIKANDALRTGSYTQDADVHAVDDQPVGMGDAGPLRARVAGSRRPRRASPRRPGPAPTARRARTAGATTPSPPR